MEKPTKKSFIFDVVGPEVFVSSMSLLVVVLWLFVSSLNLKLNFGSSNASSRDSRVKLQGPTGREAFENCVERKSTVMKGFEMGGDLYKEITPEAAIACCYSTGGTLDSNIPTDMGSGLILRNCIH